MFEASYKLQNIIELRNFDTCTVFAQPWRPRKRFLTAPNPNDLFGFQKSS